MFGFNKTYLHALTYRHITTWQHMRLHTSRLIFPFGVTMERNTATTKGKEIIRTAAPNEVLRERMHVYIGVCVRMCECTPAHTVGGVEWSGVQHTVVEWSGAEWCGVEWSVVATHTQEGSAHEEDCPINGDGDDERLRDQVRVCMPYVRARRRVCEIFFERVGVCVECRCATCVYVCV